MIYTIDLDFENAKDLIVEVKEGFKKTLATVRIDGGANSFEFSVHRDILQKLVVCAMRLLKGEPTGCFYGKEKFLVGIGDEQKEFKAREILTKYPV
jgi:hypothetical protein